MRHKFTTLCLKYLVAADRVRIALESFDKETLSQVYSTIRKYGFLLSIMANCRTVMLRLSFLCFMIFYRRRSEFSSSNSVCYSFKLEEIEDVENTHIYSSLWQYNMDYGIKLRSKAAVQLLLILSGDIELCPGPNTRCETSFENITKVRGLKCFHLNIRGLWHNMAFLENIFSLHQNIDIFSLSEIHAADEPGDLYNIDGYIYVNKPRRSGRGGGVGIYISDKINWIRRHDLEKPEIECIWIEIIQKKSKILLLCAIYRPPDTSKYHHKNFDKTFNDMLLLTNELEAIIMGDINVNFLKTIMTILQ